MSRAVFKTIGIGLLLGLGSGQGLAQNCQSNPGVAMLNAAVSGSYPLPLHQLTPKPGWTPYMHPSYPDINFVHPADWPSRTLQTSQSLGVRFTARDGSGVWESNYVFMYGQAITPAQAAQYGVQNLLGGGKVLCSRDLGAVGSVRGHFIAMASGSRIAAAEGLVAYDPMSGSPIVAIYHAVVSPASEFTRITQQVYLRLFVQLYRSVGGCNGSGPDGDGDGYSDDCDSAPDDATRH